MSAKKEWLRHRINYLADNGKRWTSPKAYFEAHGLNVNSGRREFTKIIKLENEGLTHAEIEQLFTKPPRVKNLDSRPKRDQKNSDQQKSDQKKSDQQKSDHAASGAGSNKNKDIGGVERKPIVRREDVITKQLKRLTTDLHLKHRDDSSDQQIGNGGLFAKGNAAGVRSGAYMDVMKMPEPLREMVKDNCAIGGVSEIVQLEETRYVYMNQILFAKMEELDKQEAKGIVTLDDGGNEIDPLDTRARALWGLSSGLGALFGGLVQAHMNAFKTAADVDIKYTKLNTELGRIERTKEIIGSRGDDDSALEVVRKIELEGIKPPPLLVAEALKEIELMTPKIDVSGISEAELDAAVAAYEAKHAENLDIYKSRRRNIETQLLDAKAVAELGGDDNDDFEYDEDSDEDFEYSEPDQSGEFNGLSDDALALDDDDDDEWGD
ncbi:MAG: hypothetical protein ACRC1W_07005 [Shewanella sp.]